MTLPIRRALISVSDKTGLIEFARALAALNIEIISTGGTAKSLHAAGIPAIDVASFTGFPEIMDGRVKTLHPKIHGGLLAVRNDAAHESAKQTHGIADIDLLVVNLYPFEETVAKRADWNTTIENIDVGGPAMIRAAAKNHDRVTVVVSPEDYATVVLELGAQGGNTAEATRRLLAAKAFARTAAYDAAIAQCFPLNSATPRRTILPLAASAFKRCAMVKTPTRRPPSTAAPINAKASPMQHRFKARSSPTTTSMTRMQPSIAFRNSAMNRRPPALL